MLNEKFGYVFFTLICHCEVSGDKRWNLSSDVCGENLSSLFHLVILDHMGLK